MKFRYRARAQSGQIVSGVREASEEAAVLRWIRAQNMFPINIDECESAVAGSGCLENLCSLLLRPRGRVSLKEKCVFFRQMSTMINAGVSIASCLDTLFVQAESKQLATIVTDMRGSVGGGITLAEAMARHGDIFSSLEIALVQAGEEGAVLHVSLERIAAFVDKQHQLRQKIKSALAYPVLVFALAIVTLAILCTVIVPLFRKSFRNIGINEMPPLTETVFAFSDFMRGSWFCFPLLLACLWLIFKMVGKSRAGRQSFDRLKIKIPIFGDIAFKTIMARSFRTLATLISAGVPILDALEMTAGVADNCAVSDAFFLIRDNARNGVALNATVREHRFFPPLVAQMLAVGEETAHVDEVLGKVAEWYDNELEEKIRILTVIVEPLMIIVTGIIVGLVVASIFIPILQAMQKYI